MLNNPQKCRYVVAQLQRVSGMTRRSRGWKSAARPQLRRLLSVFKSDGYERAALSDVVQHNRNERK
jgi:hypothetical protein